MELRVTIPGIGTVSADPLTLGVRQVAVSQRVVDHLAELGIGLGERWAHVTLTRVDDGQTKRVIRVHAPGEGIFEVTQVTPLDFVWRKQWAEYQLQGVGLVEHWDEVPENGYWGLYEGVEGASDWVALRLVEVAAAFAVDWKVPCAVARWKREASAGPQTFIANAYEGTQNTVTSDDIKRAWDGFPLIWALEGVRGGGRRPLNPDEVRDALYAALDRYRGANNGDYPSNYAEELCGLVIPPKSRDTVIDWVKLLRANNIPFPPPHE